MSSSYSPRAASRPASVITFALSLLLRSVIVADREAANTPPQIPWGSYRPHSSQDEPAASAQDNADAKPQAHPQTSHDAMENYARLRT